MIVWMLKLPENKLQSTLPRNPLIFPTFQATFTIAFISTIHCSVPTVHLYILFSSATLSLYNKISITEKGLAESILMLAFFQVALITSNNYIKTSSRHVRELNQNNRRKRQQDTPLWSFNNKVHLGTRAIKSERKQRNRNNFPKDKRRSGSKKRL